MKNYQNFLTKGLESSVYWNEYKIKKENKCATNNYRYFLRSNFVGTSGSFVLRYNFKNYKVIMNGKNLYDHPPFHI